MPQVLTTVARDKKAIIVITFFAVSSLALIWIFLCSDFEEPSPSNFVFVTGNSSNNMWKILCFGDSLTAGYNRQGLKFWPYSIALKDTLKKSGFGNVETVTTGFSGWTTDELVDQANEVDHFLGPGLNVSLQRNNFDLVILMAGTNDIGRGRSPESIFSNLEKLMGMCFAQKVPVLILPIPDSAFLQHNHEARERRDAVTQMLKDKTANLTRSEDRLSFLAFPFHYERSSKFFDSDGLHFSEEGYRHLGTSLAVAVIAALNS